MVWLFCYDGIFIEHMFSYKLIADSDTIYCRYLRYLIVGKL